MSGAEYDYAGPAIADESAFVADYFDPPVAEYDDDELDFEALGDEFDDDGYYDGTDDFGPPGLPSTEALARDAVAAGLEPGMAQLQALHEERAAQQAYWAERQAEAYYAEHVEATARYD